MHRGIQALLVATAACCCATAHGANLLVNPEFDADVAGWLKGPAGAGYDAFWTSQQGKPAPGAAEVFATTAGQYMYLEQCVDIAPQHIDLAAYSRINGVGSDPQNYGNLTIAIFAQPACAGASRGNANATAFPGTDGWIAHRLVDYSLQANTVSVMVSLLVVVQAMPVDIQFDHVAFGATGTVGDLETVFRDGFEIPGP
jgi:hypothetical protein